MLAARVPLVALIAICIEVVLAGCDGDSPPADHRGDPLCASAQVSPAGDACDLSVTMHGHAYRLSCDLSQGKCSCFRDNRKVSDGIQFGGTVIPACTLAYLDDMWSECCGTPE